jgi:serine/threonine protein kinase
MHAFEPGQGIGRWIVRDKLGAGSFGIVYRATRVDSPGGPAGALKIFHSVDPAFARRLVREMRALARITHPNLTQILDYGVLDPSGRAAEEPTDGTPFVVTRFVAGESLEAILARTARLRRSDAVEVVRVLGDALDALHRAGLLHRDVKPSNVMIPADGGFGAAVLLDIGLTGFIEPKANTTAAGEIFGTPQYMSPEQLKGEPQGVTSDTWALTALFYEMLTGRPPFARETLGATLTSVLTEPTVFPPDVAVTEVDRRVIARGLAKDPAQRFRSAGEIAASLLSTDATIAEPPPPRPSRGAITPPLSAVSRSASETPAERESAAPRTAPPLVIGLAMGVALLVVGAAIAWALAQRLQASWLVAPVAGAIATAIAFALLGWATWSRKRSRAAVAQELGIVRGANSRRSLLTASLAISVDRLIEQTRRNPRASLVSASIALVMEDYREAKRGNDRARALDQAMKLFEALERAVGGASWLERNQKVVAFAAGILALFGTAATQLTTLAVPAVRIETCPSQPLSGGDRFTFAPILSKDPEKLVDRSVWTIDGNPAGTGAVFTWQAPPLPEHARYVVKVTVPGVGSATCSVAVAPR